ncbi:MAG: hypothetical protein Q7O66_15105 [Dehalococcoidia bacterium]|nr:hypothetical protein [Dehalococcoidia bacterium]
MSRLDELEKSYPAIPRDVILKWEIGCRGVRDTEVIEEVGTWQRALGTYQSYDRGESLTEMAKKHPGRVRPGFLLRPPPLFMTRGRQPVRIGIDASGPHEFRAEGSGKYALYKGEEKVQKVFFPPPTPGAEDMCFAYSGELGAYALAGGIGNWARLAGIPDDANWIANFKAQ